MGGAAEAELVTVAVTQAGSSCGSGDKGMLDRRFQALQQINGNTGAGCLTWFIIVIGKGQPTSGIYDVT